ncbi:MAG: hypothetical protein HYX26_04785 [Acidobacteriales bacterium]|nr:hypothetical protein [Terriglobales bacterium]
MAFVTAKDIHARVRYLPERTRKALAGLSADEIESVFLGTPLFWPDGYYQPMKDAERIEDYASLLTLRDTKRGRELTFRKHRLTFAGDIALLQVEVRYREGAPGVTGEAVQRLQYWFRAESGSWAINDADLLGYGDQPHAFDSDEFIERRISSLGRNEREVIARLTSLQSLLDVYPRTHPEEGFPEKLEDLAMTYMPGPGEGSSSEEVPSEETSSPRGDSFVLTPDMVRKIDVEPYLAARGYRISYRKLESGGFRISARPDRYLETGKRSFYMDASGTIRSTAEDREARETDAIAVP